LKSGRLLLTFALAGAIVTMGLAVPGQVAPDSSGSKIVPYFDRPIDPDLYLIRPGEQLEVVFINAQLPNLSLEVDAESRIVHQKLGVFDLTGRTLSEARLLLLEPLSRLYNADRIDISIKRVYAVSVRVTGSAARPGRYVGYTSQRVSEMIDSAGGVTTEGSRRSISFISGDRRIPVDLDRAEFSNDDSLNPNLYAGDHIHIPEASEASVYVMGEVHDPGSVELLPDDDLELLIELAGGVCPWGDLKAAYVLGDSTRDLQIRGGIREGDFIVVPRQAAAPEKSDYVVIGAVRSPGRYSWSKGVTAADLLSAAGGLTEQGNTQRIVVFRRARHEILGTPTNERYPLPLSNVNAAGELVLEPADSIVVAALVGFVRVAGEVVNPGIYPYKAGENAAYYIALAGGIRSGQGMTAVSIYDPVSKTARAGETRDSVYDGQRIVVRRMEPLQ